MMPVGLVIPWPSIGTLIAKLERVVRFIPRDDAAGAIPGCNKGVSGREERARRGPTGRWGRREAPAEYRLDAA